MTSYACTSDVIRIFYFGRQVGSPLPRMTLGRSTIPQVFFSSSVHTITFPNDTCYIVMKHTQKRFNQCRSNISSLYISTSITSITLTNQNIHSSNTDFCFEHNIECLIMLFANRNKTSLTRLGLRWVLTRVRYRVLDYEKGSSPKLWLKKLE